MNILIPYSWLKDYFTANRAPEKVAEQLSLHSFSVEKIKKEKGDFIFEIEVTPNRGDALSVLGIARELQAILPGKFKEEKISSKKTKGKDSLKVKIKKKELVPRFSAIVLDNIAIKESPKIIKERLLKVGIRPINNIVDITNYLMIDRGQPMHAFDFDKIKRGEMVIEESKRGEKIKTLDGTERTLPEGVIVIKDGEGRLIDLCGIMGAENSQIDKNTKKILLFVQVYSPTKIRRASMILGHRTDAALRFEKGIDFEGVIPSLWKAVQMAEDTANAKISSDLIDIRNMNQKRREIAIDYDKISLIAGVDLGKKTIDTILKKLGFEIKEGKALPPSWRANDIEETEDLAEEVIRIYGYHKIPSTLFKGALPLKEDNSIFHFENAIKDFLKFRGFFECYTYTLTGKASKNALRVTNPLTEDFTFLRDSLIPQLKEVVGKNKERSMVFEISSVFIPQKNSLPLQPRMLSAVVKKMDFLEFKGIIEALFKEIGIPEEEVASFKIEELEEDIFTIEINLEKLIKKSKRKRYVPISKFSPIKEDLTLVIPEGILYPEIRETIVRADKRIKEVNFKYIYRNFITLSVLYHDRRKQISSEDTQEIRKKVFSELDKKLKVKLRL